MCRGVTVSHLRIPVGFMVIYFQVSLLTLNFFLMDTITVKYNERAPISLTLESLWFYTFLPCFKHLYLLYFKCNGKHYQGE